jgi:hypothetical protein
MMATATRQRKMAKATRWHNRLPTMALSNGSRSRSQAGRNAESADNGFNSELAATKRLSVMNG